MKNKLLIVEDNQILANTLVNSFEKEGYRVNHAHSGNLGYSMALSGGYDVMILDIMLPDTNGYDICKRIRKDKIDLPILMLTKEKDTDSIVRGMNTGADAYLAKPFKFTELLARTNALINRRPVQVNKLVEIYDLVIDKDKLMIVKNGENISLRRKEFDILSLLIQYPGRVFTRDQILERTNKNYEDEEAYPSTVDVHVSRIRSAIGKFNDNDYIQTVHGTGYKFL